MSIRREMLEAARGAGELPGDSRELVVDFIVGQMNEDGGFAGRSNNSDIYYTVFGIVGLGAFGVFGAMLGGVGRGIFESSRSRGDAVASGEISGDGRGISIGRRR